MKIKDLKQGDRITQQVDSSTISFEVLSIQPIGHRFLVTFRSAFGIESACYPGDAFIIAE